MSSGPGEELDPAERRLVEHLEIVRGAPLQATSLVAPVVRRARVQRALREPFRVVGLISQAAADGLGRLLGSFGWDRR